MDVAKTGIPTVLKLHCHRARDERGHLVKFFDRQEFLKHNLLTDFVEDLFTESRRGVLRGMHFQIPPHAQTKLVCCIAGDVLEVLIDVRRASPTYGMCERFNLTGGDGVALYVPVGIAHGFYVTSNNAVMLYKLSHEYCKESDGGILWSSIGFDWPDKRPLVSPKDAKLPRLADFETPFEFTRTD